MNTQTSGARTLLSSVFVSPRRSRNDRHVIEAVCPSERVSTTFVALPPSPPPTHTHIHPPNKSNHRRLCSARETRTLRVRIVHQTWLRNKVLLMVVGQRGATDKTESTSRNVYGFVQQQNVELKNRYFSCLRGIPQPVLISTQSARERRSFLISPSKQRPR